MSKAQFRKEISGFTREQLVELLCEVYDARKDFKDYFEFYLDPDSKKLFEKYIPLIEKENRRSKRGVCKARISVIKQYIKEFLSFSPDTKYVDRIYIHALSEAMLSEQLLYVPDTYFTSYARLTEDYLKLCEKSGRLDEGIHVIKSWLELSNFGTMRYRRAISDAVDDYINARAI